MQIVGGSSGEMAREFIVFCICAAQWFSAPNTSV